MLKMYISHWKEREKPEEGRIDYWFAPDAQTASIWASEEEAVRNCAIFEGHRIRVRLVHGGMYSCGGFKVEERAPNEFAVFFEVPSPLEPPGQCSV